VSATVDNWGSDVDAVLVADEYERISAGDCAGTMGTVPAVNGRPILFGVSKECAPFATLKWMTFPALAEGLVPFGTVLPQGEVAMNGPIILSDTAVIASYSLVPKPALPHDIADLGQEKHPTGVTDYQTSYDLAQQDELELAKLADSAFGNGDYGWVIRCLERAQVVQHSKVWMARYPLLAVSYLLAMHDERKYEETLQDMLQAMTVPFTYLYHTFPRSQAISEMRSVEPLLPPKDDLYMKGIIQHAESLTSN
jgi:hypothetical protein